MKREIQLFFNSQKSFIFCDYDWKPLSQDNSESSDQKDIYFQAYNEIYLWECGLRTGQKTIDSYLLYKGEFTEHITFRDSSFVLYDSIENTIIAARDFMGNYPLYYFASSESNNFAFSFSMNALVASKLFPIAINYQKIIEYVACEIHSPPNNHTFYQGVYRLLPAYVIRIKQGYVSEFRRYGKFDLIKHRLLTDTEYIKRFQELFTKSVKKHTDSFKKVAATLSGGLDSSSVCSVAQSLRKEPIHTFNFNTQTAASQEDEYIDSVINQWHTSHQTITPSYSGYDAIKKIIELNGQPYFVFNYTIQLDLIKAAQQNNCDVFLSGHWGDQVVNYGTQYIEELVNKRNWKNAKIAINQHFQYSLFIAKSKEIPFDKKNSNTVKLYIGRLLLGKIKKQNEWHHILRTLRILRKHFNYKFSDLFSLFQQKLSSKNLINRLEINTLIRPEVILESEKIKKRSPLEILDVSTITNAPVNFAQTRHLAAIFKGNQIYGQEEYFEIYRQNFLRSAQPFFDADLLELSLSVPLRIKFDEGRKRGTLRKALSNYLPEKVANRTTKANFTEHYVNLFKILWADFDTHTPADHPVWQLVNKKAFEQQVAIVLNDQQYAGSRHTAMPTVVRIIHLALWLDYVEQLRK